MSSAHPPDRAVACSRWQGPVRGILSVSNGGWVSFAIHTICDADVAKAETHRHSARHPKLVLTTTILASSLAFIDGSVVNVGLPAISTTFHAGQETCSGSSMPIFCR